MDKRLFSCGVFVDLKRAFHSNFTVIFLGQFCPSGKGAMGLTLCKAPIHETTPDHNALLFSISVWVL